MVWSNCATALFLLIRASNAFLLYGIFTLLFVRKTLFASLLLFCASWCPAAAQSYLIDLTKQSIALEPSGHYQVTQVVDARPDRSRLGAVYQGLDNVLTSVNFSQPFEEALSGIVQRVPPGAATRPVVMRVHTLSVGEEIRTTAETGTVELVVDYLQQRGADYAVLLTTGETLETGGLDVTGKHAGLVALGLRNSLLRLAALPPDAPALGTLLTWEQVLAGKNGPADARYPIQQEPLRRGIYNSFEEFRANRPGIVDEPFVLSTRKRTGKQWAGADAVDAAYLYLSPEKPARPVRNVWGMCDGGKAYILYRNDFFELQPSGNSYTFLGITPANSNDVAAASIVGGLAGAALASAISGGQPRPYEVHLSSGRVIASAIQDITDAQGFARADTAAVYLYRRPDAAPTQALTIVADGREIGTLLPNSYLALSWADRRRKLTVCAQGTQQACHSFVPDFAAVTYLECSVPGAVDATPAFKQVVAKEGIFYVKKFRARQRNR